MHSDEATSILTAETSTSVFGVSALHDAGFLFLECWHPEGSVIALLPTVYDRTISYCYFGSQSAFQLPTWPEIWHTFTYEN